MRGFPPYQEQLESALVVSRHSIPQPSPQEWPCGCVTAAYVTDRDALAGEQPFEMRLWEGCDTEGCEVEQMIQDVKPRAL